MTVDAPCTRSGTKSGNGVQWSNSSVLIVEYGSSMRPQVTITFEHRGGIVLVPYIEVIPYYYPFRFWKISKFQCAIQTIMTACLLLGGDLSELDKKQYSIKLKNVIMVFDDYQC